MRFLPLSCLLPLLACGGADSVAVDSGVQTDEFCLTLAEGGRVMTDEGGASGASGALVVRVISSETTDPRDPLYVAFKDYALENIATGGVQTTGKTSGDGLVREVLGEGTWRFRAAYPRGSRTCTAELEVAVEAGNTTHGCAVMTCPV